MGDIPENEIIDFVAKEFALKAAFPRHFAGFERIEDICKKIFGTNVTCSEILKLRTLVLNHTTKSISEINNLSLQQVVEAIEQIGEEELTDLLGADGVMNTGGRRPNENTRQIPGRKIVKATVNDRMLRTIQKNPDSMGWKCTQWAKYLQCRRSSVVEAETWTALESARLKSKAECMSDRRRKPKSSDTKRE
jgi:hypothetical protein